MYPLVSRWKLRNGLSLELREALNALAAEVHAHEDGTWMYAVHVDNAVPDEQQTEIVFYEVYANEPALQAHINGDAFTNFCRDYLDHFYLDTSASPGPQALMETTMLDHIAGFTRPVLAEPD